jgi:Family of unknown function (DUF6499)
MRQPKTNPPKPIPAAAPDPNFDEAFNQLIPKARPAQTIHPESSERFAEPSQDEWKSVTLDEESSHHEFAWEFLRRNRFYQALVDEAEDALPETVWGYRWTAQAARTHGLTRLKPYWESYSEGNPPAWQGLDSFAQRLPSTVSQEPSQITLNLQAGQVAIVFDVGGILNGQSAWDIQTWAARERLNALCQATYHTTEVKYGLGHKRVLVRRLALLKMLDDGRELQTAFKDLYKVRKPFAGKQLKNKPKTPKTDPTDQANQKAAAFMVQAAKTLSQTPSTTAFEDAAAIYKYIYRHGYIDLLRGEKTYQLDRQSLIPHGIALRETTPSNEQASDPQNQPNTRSQNGGQITGQIHYLDKKSPEW